MSGPLISSKSASSAITLATQLGTSFAYDPSVEINSGSGAELQSCSCER